MKILHTLIELLGQMKLILQCMDKLILRIAYIGVILINIFILMNLCFHNSSQYYHLLEIKVYLDHISFRILLMDKLLYICYKISSFLN